MNAKQAAAIALTLIIAIPILAGFAFASDTTTRTQTTVDSTVSISDKLLNDSTYYYSDYSGPRNNGLMFKYVASDYHLFTFTAPSYAYTSTSETSLPVGSNATQSVSLTTDYISMSTFGYTDWSLSGEAIIYARIIHSDGSVDSISRIDAAFFKSGSTMAVKEGGNSPIEVYDLVSDVEIAADSATTVTLNYYQTGTTTYADAAYGWSVPSLYYWVNGYDNRAVTFYLHMDAPGSGTKIATFEPLYMGKISFVMSSAGVMSIAPGWINTTYTLGTYNDVQIIYDLETKTCTVNGIAAWPTMGGSPATFNSVSFTTYNSGFDRFSMVEIGGDTTALWRCDSAEVAAGTFPVTKNYTLSMNKLFPDKEYNLKIHSVGLYGDTLRVGGSTYAVTDGTIRLDGEDVNVRGLEIKVIQEGSAWIWYINNIRIGSAATPPTINFGGVWSLTASAEILGEETVTVEEWIPGQFAFDKDNFVLMLLLTAVAVFVALGFTAGRSGGKTLALLITCGGAAAIALMMV